MSLLLMQNGLRGFFRLLTTTLVAGWTASPMSWSPDSHWLSYTVAPGTGHDEREPGWLFDVSYEGASPADPRGSVAPKASGSSIYRIWTSNRDAQSSVMIEESAWPLTAPSWSPQGRTIAFGRFVPSSIEPHHTIPRGRLEIVIQQGLNRKRTLLDVPDFELGPEPRAMFPHVAAAWSPDGRFLAFTRPGEEPAILIIRIESRRVLQTIEHAVMPSWSPDGSKVAFIRIRPEELEGNRLEVVEHQAQTFTAARPLISLGRMKATPFWTSDGRSIYVVVEKRGPQSSMLDLERVFVETGDAVRVQSLAGPEIHRRGTSIRGVAIDFDRQEERCFFAVDFEGRDTDVAWSVPRESSIFKRFHPLDGSLRIGSLSVSPDGGAVALRFGTPTALTLPAVYDVATEQTSLMMPDAAARGAWMSMLAQTARALLLERFSATVDRRIPGRPTLLPLPGEIPPHHSALPRLARLGRLGSTISNIPSRPVADQVDPEASSAAALEDRLFFDYLRGDFAAAEADLDALEPRLATAGHRLPLLSLRAQILMSKGDTIRARAVADYLVRAEGGPIHRIEETSRGPVLTTEPDASQAWARYLSSRTNANEPAPAAVSRR